jgi:hypothetical protein
MRMLRDFKALSYQFAQMFLSCTMFQPTTKARNYRILYVMPFFYHLVINIINSIIDKIATDKIKN